MNYHKNLSAERIRLLPSKTQIGMIASELSRTQHLLEQDGGADVYRCLQRAREILGVMESLPSLPKQAVPVLLEIARELSLPNLRQAAPKSGALYLRLMALYSVLPDR